ncbi:MAG: alpha/beta fold hydrolase [Verrucomicrobia bacterium]|nr:alpha/beta fold hydrolase [Verrucomicrobiota bacterium]
MVNAMTKLPESLRAIYSFEPKSFTTAGGAKLSYLDEGPRNDEAVLMLHGNPTWSFFYRDVVRSLSPSMRCIVPDHIGMGLSEKPENYDYSLGTRIADIEALVASLGLKKIHLIVHDWGGAIGFGFATRHPELIGRMVILNTAAFFSTHIPKRIALCRAGFFGKWLVRGLNGFAGPASWMSTVRPLAPEVKRGFLFPYDSWANRVAVHRFVQDIPMCACHATRQVLDGIEAKLPLLADREKIILWGGKDFCFNDHFLKRWREIYPQAPVQRYADAGHYVLEDAGDDARQRIRDFITSKTL